MWSRFFTYTSFKMVPVSWEAVFVILPYQSPPKIFNIPLDLHHWQGNKTSTQPIDSTEFCGNIAKSNNGKNISNDISAFAGNDDDDDDEIYVKIKTDKMNSKTLHTSIGQKPKNM